MVLSQTVPAIYENGKLTPLKKVNLRPRQKVRVKIIPFRARKRPVVARRRAKADRAELVKLARESFGMWADRDDIGDAVEWINALRATSEERMKRIYGDG